MRIYALPGKISCIGAGLLKHGENNMDRRFAIRMIGIRRFIISKTPLTGLLRVGWGILSETNNRMIDQGANGAAPSWQMMMGRGGTNVRFGVSQQAKKLACVRDRNEPIGTHAHSVIGLGDRPVTHA